MGSAWSGARIGRGAGETHLHHLGEVLLQLGLALELRLHQVLRRRLAPPPRQQPPPQRRPDKAEDEDLSTHRLHTVLHCPEGQSPPGLVRPPQQAPLARVGLRS